MLRFAIMSFGNWLFYKEPTSPLTPADWADYAYGSALIGGFGLGLFLAIANF